MPDKQPTSQPKAAKITPSFLDEISIDREPVDVLGRALAASHDALRDMNISLAFGSFVELKAVNVANLGSWWPMFPTFDHENGLLNERDAFWLCGRNPGGDVVCSWASRMFDWRHTTYAAEAESLRMLYADPHSAVGVRHAAQTPAARALSGRIAFEGGGWLRPDYRGKGVMPDLGCVARCVAAARWDIDYFAAITSTDLHARGMAPVFGFANSELGLTFEVPVGIFPVALLWASRDEAVEVIRARLSHHAAQIDSGIVDSAG